MDNIQGLPITRKKREELYFKIEELLKWKVEDGLYFFTNGNPIKNSDMDARQIATLDARSTEVRKRSNIRLPTFDPLLSPIHLGIVEREFNLPLNCSSFKDHHITRIWDKTSMDIIAEYESEFMCISRLGAILQVHKVNIGKYLDRRRT
jgi:hypothetical protein